MAFNGMPQIPSVSQGRLAITATQFSSFATPAITVPFPSVYAGQTQIPFTFSATPTYAATRVPTTLGGQAATAGVHSINSEASAAGYRTHDYGNNGGGSGWPVWATAVIATAGGLAVILVVVGLLCWRHRKRQKASRRAGALAGAQGPQGFKERKDFYKQPGGGGGAAAGAVAAVGGAAALGEKSRRSHRPPAVDTQGPGGRPSAYGQGDYPMQPYANGPTQPTHPDQPITPTRPTSFAQQQQYSAAPPGFPAYVPFRNHQREDSAGSNTGLLPPAAGFAYGENSPDHHGGWATTPPRRAPNDYAGDSPHSPAHLLVNGNGYGPAYGYNDTPRSSTTVSTGGTGGDPYRWDQDPDLADHMPNPEEASAALGRAMMGGGFQHGGEEYHHPLSSDAGGGGAAMNPVTPERHHLPTGYRLSAEQDASAYGARAAPARGGGGGGGGSMALAAAYAQADRAPSPASYPPPVSRPHSRNASRPRSAAAATAARDSAHEGRRSVTPSAVSGGRRSVDGGYDYGGGGGGGGGSSSRGSSRPRSAQPPVSLAPPIALPRRSLDQQQQQSTGRRSLDVAPSRRPTSRTSNHQQHRRSAYDPSWDDASVYSDQQDAAAAAAVRSSTPNTLQQAANFVGRRPSRSYRPAQ